MPFSSPPPIHAVFRARAMSSRTEWNRLAGDFAENDRRREHIGRANGTHGTGAGTAAWHIMDVRDPASTPPTCDDTMENRVMPRFFALAALLLGVLAAAPPARAQFKTQVVASNLELPLFCTSPPGDTSRLFVVEWKGKVRIIKNGVLLPDPFLDITDLVLWDNFERGLLGMAFDPNYDDNGWFYLYFINLSGSFGSSAIRRFTVSADPDSADRATLHRIFTLPQIGHDHNGGHIEFDDDGMLWLGLGDGANFPGNDIAQDPGSLFGKMIRIDPYSDDFPADATNNYAIPPDNPFVGVAIRTRNERRQQ